MIKNQMNKNQKNSQMIQILMFQILKREIILMIMMKRKFQMYFKAIMINKTAKKIMNMNADLIFIRLMITVMKIKGIDINQQDKTQI